MAKLLHRIKATISRWLRIPNRVVRSTAGRTDGPSGRWEAVSFLREWLPPSATECYRQMIRANPESWYRDPHFASGYVVDTILRGNGITERMLGVESLHEAWPALLRQVVEETPGASSAPSVDERNDELSTDGGADVNGIDRSDRT